LPEDCSNEPGCKGWFATTENAAAVHGCQRALRDSKVSDGSYDGFVGRAVSAIIDAQIKTGVLRFDTGQYQRPATFGAGRPKGVDKLKIQRVYHGTDQSAPLRLK